MSAKCTTELNNRTLTYGGVNLVNPNLFAKPDPLIIDLLAKKAEIRVDQINETIEQYNRFAETAISQPTEADFAIAGIKFVLPKRYATLNIEKYLNQLFVDDVKRLSAAKQVKFYDRFQVELDWFIDHNKLDVLRTLVYIVDRLETENIPWGVGRGSSVSSYLLYLIGVHDIHPIVYDLDWREFLRDKHE